MKALSIQQPWAWAIIRGGKDIENRSWPTNYKGPVLIHTGKTVDRDAYAWIVSNENRLGCYLPHIDQLEVGGIVGKVQVVKCVENHNSRWFFGPYGFVLDNPEPLSFIKYPGKLGLFDIGAEDISKMRKDQKRNEIHDPLWTV